MTTPDEEKEIGDLVGRIREVHPNLTPSSVTHQHGQFNDAVIVNDEYVFRFPRSAHAARMLASEVAVLRAIRPFIGLAIPEPKFGDPDASEPFVGYRLIPGEPLRRETLVSATNPVILQRFADDLARFLSELHAVPLDVLGPDIPVRDQFERWVEMYDDVRELLFPHMRTEAREDVREHFEPVLADRERLRFTPAMRHGDFGAGNILWDARTGSFTGVIDFSFAGVGDPAIDAAAISTFGEPFLERLFNVYPALESMLDRARFYRGTYMLIEALDGLRDGDQEHFESGIRPYL